MGHRSAVTFARLLLVVLSAAACGGGSKMPTVPTAPSGQAVTTSFQGTLAGTQGETGTLSLTMQAQGAAAASGTATLSGGQTFNLTGASDASAGTINLSGGEFVFTGSINQGIASGTYMRGRSMGGFSALDATRNTVTSFCGTYRSTGPGTNRTSDPSTGPWNVQVSSSGQASGIGIGTNCNTARGCTVFLNGSINGTTMTLTGSGFDEFRQLPTTYNITGTVQGGSVTGSFTGTDSSGTFSGSSNGCQ